MRQCPKCGKQHEGEGLPPSMKNRLICEECFRRREKFRQRKDWIPETKPDKEDEFEKNMIIYLEWKRKSSNFPSVRFNDYFDTLREQRAVKFAIGKKDIVRPLDPFPEMPEFLQRTK